MTTTTIEEDLAAKLDPRRFTAMSGKLAALLSYVIGTERWVGDPRIVEAAIDSSGNILVTHAAGSGGGMGEWFGGTADELDSNLKRLVKVAGLTPVERKAFRLMLRRQITDWRRA